MYKYAMKGGGGTSGKLWKAAMTEINDVLTLFFDNIQCGRA